MISVRSFIKLFLALAFIHGSQAGQICPLCGSVFNVPTRWDYPVSTTPYKTCRDIYFQLGSMSITHPQCAPEQEKYQDVCCNQDLPPGWDRPPTPAPVSEQGKEPMCRICTNDEYPGLPNVFISARYVGEFTCGSLFHRGRNGLIPGFMCGPLQDYAYEKCGCGSHNPGNRSPTSDPSPDPTPDPSPDPTPDPSPDPTPDPSPAPVVTPDPTPTPSDMPSNVPSRPFSDMPSDVPSIDDGISLPTANPSVQATSTTAGDAFCTEGVRGWCCANNYEWCCSGC